MRFGVACLLVIATLGCARKSGPAPESESPTGAVAERDGAAVDADACSHYLADAPPPASGDFNPNPAASRLARCAGALRAIRI